MSGHVNKVEICTSCQAPLHVTSCDVLHDTEAVVGCAAGVGWTRYTVHAQAGGAIIDTFYLSDTGVTSANQPLGWSSVPRPPQSREFELGCFTTTGGVSTPVRIVETVTNGVVAVSYVNLLTGAAYVPAATSVFGTDCPKYDWETVVLCDNRTVPYTPFMRHMARLDVNGVSTVAASWDSGIGSFAAQPTVPSQNSVVCDDIDFVDELGCANGVPYVRRTYTQGQTVLTVSYVNSAGAIVPAPAGWVLGSCVAPQVNITTDLACAAGVQVLRQQTFTNGVLTNTTWQGANGVTIVAPTVYTWGQCAGASSSPDVELLVLCDNNGPFLQVTSYTSGVATITNRNMTNTANYTPVGTVGACNDVDVERETICYQTAVNAAVVSVVRVSTYRDGVLISTVWLNPVTGAAATTPPGTAIIVDCPTQARTQTQSIVQSGTAVGNTVVAAAGFAGYAATLVWTLTTAPPNGGRGTYGTIDGVGVPLGYSTSVEADENWTLANNMTFAVSVAGAKWVIVRRAS